MTRRILHTGDDSDRNDQAGSRCKREISFVLEPEKTPVNVDYHKYIFPT